MFLHSTCSLSLIRDRFFSALERWTNDVFLGIASLPRWISSTENIWRFLEQTERIRWKVSDFWISFKIFWILALAIFCETFISLCHEKHTELKDRNEVEFDEMPRYFHYNKIANNNKQRRISRHSCRCCNYHFTEIMCERWHVIVLIAEFDVAFIYRYFHYNKISNNNKQRRIFF